MEKLVIAGKYELLRRIALGGMAEVFLAKQLGFDGFEKLVVVKTILPHLAGRTEYVQMFLDEARTAADLQHTNVVHTFEVGEDQGRYFMAMEFLDGRDLRMIAKLIAEGEEKIPLPVAVGIVMDAAAGLHYAHKKKDLAGKSLGIIHRDVSPQNIVVSFQGITKIVDFGIAKSFQQTSETLSGVLKGKYSYMSPEQAAALPLDPRSDQFSLGIVLYELTTNSRLFKRENESLAHRAILDCDIEAPSKVDLAYPTPLESIVLRALSREPGARFQNCEEFRLALDRFLFGQGYVHAPQKIADFMKPFDQGDRGELSRNVLWGQAIGQESESQGSKNEAKISESEELWPEPRLDTKPVNEVGTGVSNSHAKTQISFSAQMGIVALLGGGLGVIVVILTLSLLPQGQISLPFRGGGVLEVADAKIASKDKAITFGATAASPKGIALARGQKSRQKRKMMVKKAPTKKQGRLKVVVNPWANVFLNGEKIGSTPLAPRELSPGKYTLVLENPTLNKRETRLLVIKPGNDTLVTHSW